MPSKTPEKQPTTKTKAGGGKSNALQKPLQPSPELAAVVGPGSLPRTEVVSKVRSEEHTSELQSRQSLHSFPTRRSSDLAFPVALAAAVVLTWRTHAEQDTGEAANDKDQGWRRQVERAAEATAAVAGAGRRGGARIPAADRGGQQGQIGRAHV